MLDYLSQLKLEFQTIQAVIRNVYIYIYIYIHCILR